jgi:hypothetical protein
VSEQVLLKSDPGAGPVTGEPFRVSNAMLLSGRQWVGLGLLAALFIWFMPDFWKRIEPLPRLNDVRIPYELSSDYWLFERLAEDAVSRCDAVLLGDSFVWGQYVTREDTLSSRLNARAGGERFANLGVDGMHPAALAGLIGYHGGAIAGKKVLLHLNPLWMSSPRHDLQGEDEFRFNHPALVPQFFPTIPCYREEVSRRLGLVVERYVPFLQWTSHLQLAYVDQTSVPEWTIEHPCAIPPRALARELPFSGERLRHRPVPWTEQGIVKQDFAWVELERSFQWRSFQGALESLRRRGNRVFVLLGPFNEHLLTDKGREGYLKLCDGMARWLSAEGVEHDVPPVLASELYADASHPLAEGYRLLAERIFARLGR